MSKEKVFIWGTGKNDKTLRSIFKNFLKEIEIIGYIDNDIKKHHTQYEGYTIFAPEEINQHEFDRIIIFSTFFEDIEQQLVNDLSIQRNKIDNYRYFTYKRIANRYHNTCDEELQGILHFANDFRLEVFNYEFIKKYYEQEIYVFYDDKIHLFYVIHHSKRMYFSRRFKTEKEVKRYYRSILIEQDANSPHRYLTPDFDVKEGDVVIDAGVAEGNFALDIIERASKLYLIESDEDWIEALTYTFSDYMDKIEIIPKVLVDFSGPETVCLNDISVGKIDFIKMDIEGCELEALQAASNIIEQSSNLRIAACCYHRDNDDVLISKLLQSYGMSTEFTKGYMWSPIGSTQKYYNPKFRHGIIRATL